MSKIPVYENALAAAQMDVPAFQIGRLPWERSTFLRQVLGQESESVFKRPRITLERNVTVSTASSSASVELRKEISLHIPRVKPDTKHLVSSNPEAGRQQAINAWLQILKLDLHESITGRQIVKFCKATSRPMNNQSYRLSQWR